MGHLHRQALLQRANEREALIEGGADASAAKAAVASSHALGVTVEAPAPAAPKAAKKRAKKKAARRRG